MSFIPNNLQELKRKAEAALGRLMLLSPDDAHTVGTYFGSLESELLPKPHMSAKLQTDSAEEIDIALVGFDAILHRDKLTVYFESPVRIEDRQQVAIRFGDSWIHGTCARDDFHPATEYHILTLKPFSFTMDFRPEEK